MPSYSEVKSWVVGVWTRWRSVISTIGADGLLAGFGLVSSILTARLLLPEGKGELTAVLLWPRLFASVGALGVGNGVVYFAGQEEADEGSLGALAGNLAVLSILQGAVIGVAGYLAVPYLLAGYSDAAIQMAQVMFLWAPFARMYRYSLRMLLGIGRFRPWNVVRVGRKGIYALAIVLVGLFGVASVEYVVWGYLAADLLGFLAVLVVLRLELHTISFDLSMIKGILSYGLRDVLSSLVGRANYEMDQAIISLWLSAESLGLYRVALSGSKLLRPLSAGFKKILFSDVSKSDSEEEADRLISESLRASIPVLGLSSVVAAASMPIVMPLLFGEEYSGGILAAAILCIGAGVMGLKQILYNGARGQGAPQIPFYCELIALAVTGIALFALLPILGIVGAALASVIAYASGLAAVFVFLRPDLSGKQEE